MKYMKLALIIGIKYVPISTNFMEADIDCTGYKCYNNARSRAKHVEVG